MSRSRFHKVQHMRTAAMEHRKLIRTRRWQFSVNLVLKPAPGRLALYEPWLA
jgi:hypothetical protein